MEKTNGKTSPFGKRLMQAFEFAPKSEIASKLGVANSAITNYLQGRIPDADLLRKISDFTNCSIHWLVTGEGTRAVVSEKEAGLVNVTYLKDVIREVIRDEMARSEIGPFERADVMVAPSLGKVGDEETEAVRKYKRK